MIPAVAPSGISEQNITNKVLTDAGREVKSDSAKLFAPVARAARTRSVSACPSLHELRRGNHGRQAEHHAGEGAEVEEPARGQDREADADGPDVQLHAGGGRA